MFNVVSRFFHISQHRPAVCDCSVYDRLYGDPQRCRGGGGVGAKGERTPHKVQVKFYPPETGGGDGKCFIHATGYAQQVLG